MRALLAAVCTLALVAADADAREPVAIEKMTCRDYRGSAPERKRLHRAVYAELERRDALDPYDSEAGRRGVIRAMAATYCLNTTRAERRRAKVYRPTVRHMVRYYRAVTD